MAGRVDPLCSVDHVWSLGCCRRLSSGNTGLGDPSDCCGSRVMWMWSSVWRRGVVLIKRAQWITPTTEPGSLFTSKSSSLSDQRKFMSLVIFSGTDASSLLACFSLPAEIRRNKINYCSQPTAFSQLRPIVNFIQIQILEKKLFGPPHICHKKYIDLSTSHTMTLI